MFEIISTETCEFCKKAKARLESLGLEYRESLLDTPEKQHSFREAGFKTVPQIYHNGSLIGGFNDLVRWLVVNPQKPHFVDKN
jgi:glutaredoxin